MRDLVDDMICEMCHEYATSLINGRCYECDGKYMSGLSQTGRVKMICSKCGLGVDYGDKSGLCSQCEGEACQTGTPGWVETYVPPDAPSSDRIAAALERIAAALEKR